jgi:hypothetical protein
MSDQDGEASVAAWGYGRDWIHVAGPRRLMPVPVGADGRCAVGCLSIEKSLERANPGYAGDGIAEAVRCYSCEGWVCLCCGTAPVAMSGRICDPCGKDS